METVTIKLSKYEEYKRQSQVIDDLKKAAESNMIIEYGSERVRGKSFKFHGENDVIKRLIDNIEYLQQERRNAPLPNITYRINHSEQSGYMPHSIKELGENEFISYLMSQVNGLTERLNKELKRKWYQKRQ